MAQLLQQLAGDTDDLVDGLYHVDGDADGAGLVGDGPGDGLTDPPGGIGGELKALGEVELLHGLDQAQVCLLYTSDLSTIVVYFHLRISCMVSQMPLAFRIIHPSMIRILIWRRYLHQH